MPKGRLVTSNPVNRRHFLNRGGGRVAWWLPLPHLYGGGRLYDLMGLSHGTLAGTATWARTIRGLAVATDGSAGCGVDCGAVPAVYGASPLTLAAWITPKATGRNDYAGIWHTTTFKCLLTTLNGSNFQFFVSEGASTPGSGAGATSYTVGTPYRVVGTYDGSTIRLYVNGVQDASAASSVTLNTAAGTFWIGRSGDSTSNASIGDVSVWNRVLSAAEVWADYDLSRRGYPGVLNRRSPALLLLMSAAGTTTVAVTDSGAGAEAIGSTAQLKLSDPGGGLEYAGMAATFARTDSGAGADSLVPVIFVKMTDAGGASDALKLGPVSILLPDAGAGAEAAGLAASFRIADPGAGADVLSPTVLATMADAGSGRDSYAVAAVSILLTDSGTGDEASNLAGSFRLTDSGAGADALAAGLAVVVFDSGAGADSLATAVATAAVVVAMADSGSGHESPIVTVVTPIIPGGGYDPTFILLGGIPGFVVAVPALIRDGDVYDAIYALLSASGQFSLVTTSKTAPQAAPPSDAGASCHLVQQGAASRQEPHYARELRIPRYDLEIYVRTAFEEDPYQVADRIEAAVRDILLSKANRTLGGIVLTEYSALARTAIDFAGSPDVYVRLMGQAGYVADYDLGGFRDVT